MSLGAASHPAHRPRAWTARCSRRPSSSRSSGDPVRAPIPWSVPCWPCPTVTCSPPGTTSGEASASRRARLPRGRPRTRCPRTRPSTSRSSRAPTTACSRLARELLLERGVRRVVYASSDPNPDTCGIGPAQLAQRRRARRARADRARAASAAAERRLPLGPPARTSLRHREVGDDHRTGGSRRAIPQRRWISGPARAASSSTTCVPAAARSHAASAPSSPTIRGSPCEGRSPTRIVGSHRSGWSTTGRFACRSGRSSCGRRARFPSSPAAPATHLPSASSRCDMRASASGVRRHPSPALRACSPRASRCSCERGRPGRAARGRPQLLDAFRRGATSSTRWSRSSVPRPRRRTSPASRPVTRWSRPRSPHLPSRAATTPATSRWSTPPGRCRARRPADVAVGRVRGKKVRPRSLCPWTVGGTGVASAVLSLTGVGPSGLALPRSHVWDGDLCGWCGAGRCVGTWDVRWDVMGRVRCRKLPAPTCVVRRWRGDRAARCRWRERRGDPGAASPVVEAPDAACSGLCISDDRILRLAAATRSDWRSDPMRGARRDPFRGSRTLRAAAALVLPCSIKVRRHPHPRIGGTT